MDRKLKVILSAVFGIALVFGSVIAFGTNDGKDAYEDKSPSPSGAEATAPESIYTLLDVAKHAGKESCWSAIRGSVYDLTPWIGSHPGGAEAVLSLCGKDGTEAFDAQHKGQSSPENRLRSFVIGSLGASSAP